MAIGTLNAVLQLSNEKLQPSKFLIRSHLSTLSNHKVLF
jgi:hypothetical protein